MSRQPASIAGAPVATPITGIPPRPPSQGQLDAASWVAVALVVVCFCVPLFVGLGRADLANDEAIYSFSADVMVQSGDWLVPKASPREDMPFLEKPPLKTWIVAAPIKLGLLPRDEFGLRFWDALFGGIAFLYVFAIGRRVAGPLCGVVAVLVLFVHRPLVFEHGLRENNMEAALLLCYCGAMYHFLAWRGAVHAARRRHVVAIGLYFVLGFMCKFVAALFLPMLLAVAVLLRREDRQSAVENWRDWCGTAILVVAICAPWFLYAYYRFGNAFWSNILGKHVLTRFTSYVDPEHLQPWHYYLSKLIVELQSSQLGWFALAGGALLLARASGWRDDRGRNGADALLLLLWFTVPVVLMSSGTSKLYHYLYPFLPPVALAVGLFVASLSNWAERLLSPDRVGKLLQTAWPRRRLSRVAGSLLLTVAAFCTALALLVLVLGHVKVAVGDGFLVRSSTPVRPLLVALLALLLAARGRFAARVIVPVIVLSVPLQAYRQDLLLLGNTEHPVRSLAACMQPIAARQATHGMKGPGVYVETETLIHPLTYYLRALGPWHQLADRSDAKVYATLYLKQEPVLLSRDRREEFNRAVDTKWEEVVREAARMAGVEMAAAAAARWSVEMRAVPLPADTLLLPGPYAGCASEKRRVVR